MCGFSFSTGGVVFIYLFNISLNDAILIQRSGEWNFLIHFGLHTYFYTDTCSCRNVDSFDNR